MRKYVKPYMESETFVTNEYVSACGDTAGLACLNMNDASKVYKDNGDGVFDPTTDTAPLGFTWNQKNDCGTNGDETGGSHNINQVDTKQLYFITYRSSSTVNEAYLATSSQENGTFSDSPHFIMVKTYNHS